MTRTRPKFVAREDLRCEALVKGHPSWNFEWAKVDHRCPKVANQMRGELAVCHLHGKAKEIRSYR
jgi:hypothetical protein